MRILFPRVGKNKYGNFFCPHGRFDRYVEIADIDLTFTTIACLALRFGWFGLGIGGLFLDLLRR